MKKIILKDILFLVTTLSIIVILLLVTNITANSKIKSTSETYLKSDKNSVSQNGIQSNTKNTAFKTTILSTGKSDCILVEIGNKVIMIDTGEDKNGKQIVDRLKEKGINTLDYLILTHLDKDHIGGVDSVLSSVKVKNIIQANYKKDSKQYDEYIDSLKKADIEPVLLKDNMNIVINSAEINIQPASKSKYESSNDYSIITNISYGAHKFLFAGDAEEERLSEFINGNTLKYDFVKIPHHGRYDKLTEAFLESISPQCAVITCSEKKEPEEGVLKILERLNIKTFLTSNGEVVINSDGKTLSVNQ
ncbi:AHM family subclass B3-like metallo-beta-lactamase [Clostridioides difficile]|uniref:AHM family subclass B3-like metallo-beta-lactamase n=1 Tax=Clostridioides difficile TaxID=1496 RepID=UPI000871ECE8|nr:MBL fold metallo-hydrolase [Clostridioides difficile]AXU49222.1 metallo-beta-lactamase superfamily exported protein [Clostridioides difficile]AXU63655.1 metallo-beta-lactamase superfamily exported protein [Clostridioides difficile]EGT2200095.1 MBL fold metallo-hydrolase [Clostridioides difficile]EGT4037320.1 MBL fold metallo-hydrolase [Clostridioides difficile]EGT4908170.1 MBL fold metallo-hydrolase [Clostridioides difficile]